MNKFNVPPGWPAAEPGWIPPEGWTPDPSWPPAPDGWQFWTIEADPIPIPPNGDQAVPVQNPQIARRRPRWLVPTITGIVGLAIGLAAGGGTADPTASAQFKAVSAKLSTAQTDLTTAQADLITVQGGRDAALGKVGAADKRASDAEAGAKTAQEAVAAREATVATKEAAVAAREQAVGATEKAVADTTISEGTWTVGVDIQPGKYRTKAAVTTTCYWGIYKSGTNGDVIIQNDIVTGGVPSVTLSAGQDFDNSGCGDWVKQ